MSKALLKKMCFFILIFGAMIQFSFAQKVVLSLKQIQDEVQTNYPLVKGNDLLIKESELSLGNIKTNYLPKLYANGKISYQSDVTGFGSLKAPKDQYSVNLDVEQLIYNGGRIKSQLNLNKLSTQLNLQDLKVKMFALREKVNDAFFSILLLRKSKMVLLDKKRTVSANLKQVQSAVNSGVMASANSQVLEAEILLIDQQVKEMEAAESSAFGTLSELMNRDSNFDIKAVDLPIEHDQLIVRDDLIKDRPEYGLYSGQKSIIDEKIALEKKERAPIITGFGQLGYGKPGYNQLNTSFDSYYMLGAKLSWNIFDWKTSKRNQRILNIQKDLVETQESSFQKNQRVELRREISSISKFKILIAQDDAIVELQEGVSKSSASQLANGVITSSDYLKDLNREIQAKLNRDYHKIQLIESITEYQRIMGKIESSNL